MMKYIYKVMEADLDLCRMRCVWSTCESGTRLGAKEVGALRAEEKDVTDADDAWKRSETKEMRHYYILLSSI